MGPIHIILLIAALSWGGSAEAQMTEDHVRLDSSNTARLLSILITYNSADYYVAPNIPPTKLAHALVSCEVNEKETVYALINLTVSGKSKDCLLIASSGIYFHNSWTGTQPGRFFISWELLKSCNIDSKEKFEVVIGPTSVDISGCAMDKKVFMGLLQELKHEITP